MYPVEFISYCCANRTWNKVQKAFDVANTANPIATAENLFGVLGSLSGKSKGTF
jgi:hypothetical protein